MNRRLRPYMTCAGAAFGLILSAMLSTGEILNVPTDYPGIATAVAAADFGDVVLVQEGFYATWYRVNVGTGITIVAAGNRDETTWYIPEGLSFQDDPENPGPSMIANFHIEVESATNPNGILVINPGTTIAGNYSEDIYGEDLGYSVGCVQPAVIEANIIAPAGIGIGLSGAGLGSIVRRNLFVRCDSGSGVSRLAIDVGATASADTLLVYGNTFGDFTTGVEVHFSSTPGLTTNVRLVNNIFESNEPCIKCSYANAGNGYVGVRYNLFYDATLPHLCLGVVDCEGKADIGPGNLYDISAQFCAEYCEDYRLEPTSPAIGAGENGTTMGAFGLCGPPIDVPQSPVSDSGLRAPYPNPTSSIITFPVPGADGVVVVLRVFDGSGRLVRTIDSVVTGGGVRWDGQNGRRRAVESGVYFLQLLDSEGLVMANQRVRVVR